MIHWLWHLKHARGYRELGLYREAREALGSLPPEHAHCVDALAEQAALAQAEGRWKELTLWGEKWCQQAPEDPGAWILWAYGARRHRSLVEAERILLEALVRHAGDATIQFNLGCYACQNGDLVTALRRVLKAISIDPQFKALAREDPDLAPLREKGQL